MGKKDKVGKQRKDKYYHLAKETGFRSRSAFKLIQLNRKFGFLQKSRVCIDLCAAPGGWMQVAHETMPLSSIVVGVDLFPIKAVPGCISLVEDITTDKCKSALSKELKTWKADVVLHDGAPNVGSNWLHDAYQQACLTLSALKLATCFLKPGGWFITKVFRSKDYHAVIWVLKQLFKKVHATKPQASRNESAEIFVVCQNYIAPDHLDPKFLDIKYVFEEIDLGSKNKLNILHPEKQKKAKAEGYDEKDHTLHHQVPVSDFLLSTDIDHVELLRGCSEIIFDDKEVEDHELTTKEIKECCKDIKLLGRKDVKALLKWMKAMAHMKSEQAKNKIVEEPVVQDEDDKDLDDEEKEDAKVMAEIAELQEEERRELKRKKKQLTKQRLKMAEKMNLKMVIKNDTGPTLQNEDLFELKNLKNMEEIDKVAEQNPDVLSKDDDADDELEPKPKYMKYSVEKTHLDSSGTYYKDSDSELELESDSDADSDKESLGFSDSDDEKSDKKLEKLTMKNTARNAAVGGLPTNADENNVVEHPLLPSLDIVEPRDRRQEKAQMWFEKDSFKDLDDDEDEDVDLDKLADSFKMKGRNISENAFNKESTIMNKTKKIRQPEVDSGVSSEDTDTGSDSDTDSDYDVEKTARPVYKDAKPKRAEKQAKAEKAEKKGKAEKAGKKGKSGGTFEIVTQDKQLKELKKTVNIDRDRESLAMATMIVTSKKYKRDLVDNAWNRYTFDDKNLPDWFVEDESKNMRRPIEVPKEVEEEYRKRLEEINSRPIKKVIEARARKKKRSVKKMERAKKQVEAIMENAEMSEREKAKRAQQLYRKAKAEPKKEVTYVVAKKSNTGVHVRRPAGVTGKYRVVDARMKKDLRAMKSKEKTKNRKKKSANKRNAGRPKKKEKS